MKTHNFSISDILTRSPASSPGLPVTEGMTGSRIQENSTRSSSDAKHDVSIIPALPTPPTSPESPSNTASPEKSQSGTAQSRKPYRNVSQDNRIVSIAVQDQKPKYNVSGENHTSMSLNNRSQPSASEENLSRQDVSQNNHSMPYESSNKQSCPRKNAFVSTNDITNKTIPSEENDNVCVQKKLSTEINDTPKRTVSNKPTETHKERIRDPIGQILDNLCNNAGKKVNIGPSAFSPFVPNPWNAQLSPLTMLTQCDRRCLQTSSNINSPYQQATFGCDVISSQHSPMTQLQFIHAHKMAQQQQQQQQHGQYNATSQIPVNASLFPFITPSASQQHIQQLQASQQQQEHMMAMGACAPELLANRNCVPQMNPASPLWMTLLKSSAGETMMSYPVKESRAPPPPRYQCDACKKSYSTFGGLSKHKQFHCVSHVKKEFNCKYCEKSYGSLGALKMHIRTHTLPCKCKLCGKAFSRPWLLQGHVRTHTGEKPFSCAHCGRAFADRSNLRAHLQTHSDIKKYGCKNCTKTFSRMSLLLKHEDGSCMGLRR